MSALFPETLLASKTLSDELGRLIATAVVVVCVALAYNLWRRYLAQRVTGRASEHVREQLVWSKNIFWTVGAMAVTAIWATKIAGLALTLTALAGALLLVNKELVMCVVGYAVLVLTRPYRLGDYIEMSGFTGKVIDITILTTTLAETGSLHQLTGKTIALPNNMVHTTPVRNQTATGAFMVDLYPIALPFTADIEHASECALAAATEATEAWRAQADAHLQRLETHDFVDLPSSKPKVLWETPDSKGHVMTIRFACPVEERVSTEQVVFREFWKRYGKPPTGAPQD